MMPSSRLPIWIKLWAVSGQRIWHFIKIWSRLEWPARWAYSRKSQVRYGNVRYLFSDALETQKERAPCRRLFSSAMYVWLLMKIVAHSDLRRLYHSWRTSLISWPLGPQDFKHSFETCSGINSIIEAGATTFGTIAWQWFTHTSHTLPIWL